MKPTDEILNTANTYLKNWLTFEHAIYKQEYHQIGWIFYFNSKEYVQNGDRMEFRWGCSAIFVVEKDLSVHILSPRDPWKDLENIVGRYK